MKMKDMTVEQYRKYFRDKQALYRLRNQHKNIALKRGTARFYIPRKIKITKEIFNRYDKEYILGTHVMREEILYPIFKDEEKETNNLLRGSDQDVSTQEST